MGADGILEIKSQTMTSEGFLEIKAAEIVGQDQAVSFTDSQAFPRAVSSASASAPTR